jgi:hypothetical protein
LGKSERHKLPPREIAERISRQFCDTFNSVAALEEAIYAYLAAWNEAPNHLLGTPPLTSS